MGHPPKLSQGKLIQPRAAQHAPHFVSLRPSRLVRIRPIRDRDTSSRQQLQDYDQAAVVRMHMGWHMISGKGEENNTIEPH
jgi:hypothetical protein